MIYFFVFVEHVQWIFIDRCDAMQEYFFRPEIHLVMSAESYGNS